MCEFFINLLNYFRIKKTIQKTKKLIPTVRLVVMGKITECLQLLSKDHKHFHQLPKTSIFVK